MPHTDTIRVARALLEAVTPLKSDCGRQCAAACCRPDADGQGGMLLFPGEEAFYTPPPDWAAVTNSGVEALGRPLLFLTCDGCCPRANRPLACRIFPLTPLADGNGGVTVGLDVRAWPICPLMPHGINGLSRAFTTAAAAAAVILWTDDVCRAYIRLLTERLSLYREGL